MSEEKRPLFDFAAKKQGTPTMNDIDGLIYAAAQNDVKQINHFVETFGAQHLDARGSTGWTALTYAASRDGDNVVDAVRALLDHGAKVNQRQDFGDGDPWSPLMVAASNFMQDVVKLLVERGADPTATNKHGRTARQIHAYRACSDYNAPAPQNEPDNILSVLDAAAAKWNQQSKAAVPPAPRA